MLVSKQVFFFFLRYVSTYLCVIIIRQYNVRNSGSKGAAGAFAPVNFKQRVQCTRPDEELSHKWPFLVQKGAFSV